MPLGLYYWRLIVSRWLMVSVLVLGCGFGAWAFSTFVLAQRPSFESSARLNIVPTSEELGFATRFVRGSTFDGGSVMVQTYAEYARTRPVIDPVIEDYIGWEAKRAGKTKQAFENSASIPAFYTPGQILALLNYGEVPKVPLREDLAQSLLENTTIETVEGTYLLRIAVEWDDPVAAAWLANALSDAVVARAQNQSSRAGAKLTETLETSLAQKQAELDSLLAQSRALKQSAGVVDLDAQKQGMLEELMAEQSRLTSDRSALDAAQGQVSGLKREASGKLSTSQQAVEQALALEGPKAEGLRKAMAAREARIAQLRGQFARVSSSEQSIKALDDRIAIARRDTDALAERVSFNRNENLANAPKIEVIERAVPPVTRSSPKILINTLIGIVAGCALAGAALLLFGPGQTRKEKRAKAKAAKGADMPVATPVAAEQDETELEQPIRRLARGGTSVFAETDADFAPPPMPRIRPSYGAAAAVAEEPWQEVAPAIPQYVRLHHIITRQPDADQLTEAAQIIGDVLHGQGIGADRPLLVLASGGDADAQLFYRMVMASGDGNAPKRLRIDATQGHRPLDAIAPNSLVYGGGLLESARPDLFRAIRHAAVLVVVPSSIAGRHETLAQLSDSIRDLSGSRPLLFGIA